MTTPEPTPKPDPFKTYDQVTPDNIGQMADTWDDREPLYRHVNRWLTRHDFTWDPLQSSDENREGFYQVVDAVLDEVGRRS